MEKQIVHENKRPGIPAATRAFKKYLISPLMNEGGFLSSEGDAHKTGIDEVAALFGEQSPLLAVRAADALFAQSARDSIYALTRSMEPEIRQQALTHVAALSSDFHGRKAAAEMLGDDPQALESVLDANKKHRGKLTGPEVLEIVAKINRLREAEEQMTAAAEKLLSAIGGSPGSEQARAAMKLADFATIRKAIVISSNPGVLGAIADALEHAPELVSMANNKIARLGIRKEISL